jgi:hypothetical protein
VRLTTGETLCRKTASSRERYQLAWTYEALFECRLDGSYVCAKYSNWSWESTSLALRVAARDLLSGTDLYCGEELSLGARDVRVLLQSPLEETNREGSAP